MQRTDWQPLLGRTMHLAREFLDGLPERPVAPRSDAAAMLAALDVPLQDAPADPLAVVEELARTVDPGLDPRLGRVLPERHHLARRRRDPHLRLDWSTDDDDVRASVAAIGAAHATA